MVAESRNEKQQLHSPLKIKGLQSLTYR